MNSDIRGEGVYIIQMSRFQDIGTRHFKTQFALTLSSNVWTVKKERYLPGLFLIKRNFEGGLQLASIGEQPVKERKIYTGLLQTNSNNTSETRRLRAS